MKPYANDETVHGKDFTNLHIGKVQFKDLTEYQQNQLIRAHPVLDFKEQTLILRTIAATVQMDKTSIRTILVRNLRRWFEEEHSEPSEVLAEAIPLVSTATGLQKVTEFTWDDLSGRQQVMVDQRWPIKYNVLDYKGPLYSYMQEKLFCSELPNFTKDFAAFVNSYAPGTETPLYDSVEAAQNLKKEVPINEEATPYGQIHSDRCRMCGQCMYDEGTLALNPRETQFLDSAFDLMLKKVSQILLKPEPETISITWKELSEAFPKEKFAGVYKQYLDDKWEAYAKRLTDLFEDHLEK